MKYLKALHAAGVCLLLTSALTAQSILNVSYDLKLPNTYTNLQAAVTAASPGDTIHVYAHDLNYGGATVDKRLYILGSGYHPIDNQDSLNIQTYSRSSSIGNTYFNPGSEGSLLMGCEVFNWINISANRVTIKRNYIREEVVISNADSVEIIGNYFHNHSGCCQYFSIGVFSNSNDVICKNNIQQHLGSTTYKSVYVDDGSDALIQNNVFMDGTFIAWNSIVVDNIIHASNFIAHNSIVEHNIFTKNITAYADSNLINVNADSIFVGFPTQGGFSFDARWHLLPGSPAEGYAFDGGDCGAYAGAEPYKLSGIPWLPLIYELTPLESVIIENDSLQINIKARSEN